MPITNYIEGYKTVLICLFYKRKRGIRPETPPSSKSRRLIIPIEKHKDLLDEVQETIQYLVLKTLT
jgi:hypothetical protein